MTDVTRRGLLKAAGVLGAGATLSAAPAVVGGPATPSAAAAPVRPDGRPIELGDRLELIAGTSTVDHLDGAAFRLHQPVRREVAMTTDRPWEGSACHYRHVFRDGDTYRMYYTALDYNVGGGRVDIPHPSRVAMAESTDGLTWSRPSLGLVQDGGSTDNNLTAGTGDGHAFVFKDTRPDTPADARYKGIELADRATAIYALKSADGTTFTRMSGTPMMTWGPSSSHGLVNMAFDTLNVAFWDPSAETYRLYLRYYHDRAEDGGTYRGTMVSTSADFLTWTTPVPLEYPGSPAPEEHLYTSNVVPYYRSPGVLLGFPMRYVQPQGWQESHFRLPNPEHRRERALASERYGTAMTDTLFMSSRDGVVFDRWDEAFIQPGPGTENWKYADNSTGCGIAVTPSHIHGAPDELSVYATEGYWTGDELDVVRYTLRVDGFVSLNAPRSGGEAVTKAVRFIGDQLVLNLATSAAGHVRVEVQNPAGTPIPGFGLDECDPLFGDDLARVVSWRGGDTDLGSLASRPVRLRFAINDADVYSFRFRAAITFDSTKTQITAYHQDGTLTTDQRDRLLAHLSDAQSSAEQGQAEEAGQALDDFAEVVREIPDDAARDVLATAAAELRRIVRELTAEPWPTRYGWLGNDVDPATGNLENLGLSTSLIALDYRNRSVGAAFWEPVTITALTLRDVDGSTRLAAGDLSVYVSDTNDGDWRRVEGVQVARISNGFTFTGLDVTARYVKVVQPYADDAFTFTNQVARMLEVTTA
ncbi:FIMAH domain-containing protein [Jiangella muralis]|uniref:FIMAH domain-containing protein n=1 Tax=Jiangella muralis TaxID=702383 RepID=UPI00069D2481|nr:hypothetical protein [Jiangella muralis]